MSIYGLVHYLLSGSFTLILTYIHYIEKQKEYTNLNWMLFSYNGIIIKGY